MDQKELEERIEEVRMVMRYALERMGCVAETVVALADELAAERERVRKLEAELTLAQVALANAQPQPVVSLSATTEQAEACQAAASSMVGYHEVSDLYGIPGRLTHEYQGRWNNSYVEHGPCTICGQPPEHEVHTKPAAKPIDTPPITLESADRDDESLEGEAKRILANHTQYTVWQNWFAEEYLAGRKRIAELEAEVERLTKLQALRDDYTPGQLCDTCAHPLYPGMYNACPLCQLREVTAKFEIVNDDEVWRCLQVERLTEERDSERELANACIEEDNLVAMSNSAMRINGLNIQVSELGAEVDRLTRERDDAIKGKHALDSEIERLKVRLRVAENERDVSIQQENRLREEKIGCERKFNLSRRKALKIATTQARQYWLATRPATNYRRLRRSTVCYRKNWRNSNKQEKSRNEDHGDSQEEEGYERPG